MDIPKQISIPPGKTDGILAQPSSGNRIIIPCPEADKAGVPVMEAAGKAERVYIGVGVHGHCSPDIVIDPLYDLTCTAVDNDPGTAQVVGQDAKGLTVFFHGRRRVAFFSVDEKRLDCSRAVKLRNGVELVRIEPILLQNSVLCSTDAAVFCVNDIPDICILVRQAPSGIGVAEQPVLGVIGAVREVEQGNPVVVCVIFPASG